MVISKSLIIFFIISLVFPSGIGVTFFGQNLDVNKLCYVFCLFLGLIFWIKNPNIFNKYDTIPIFIILSIFPFSVFWVNNLQYAIFVVSIILFFSAYYVGRLIFVTKESFLYFLKNISLAYIIIGIIGILNFYLNIFSLDFLRPNAEDYISYQTRGNILGSDFIILAYKGMEWHTHFFAINRFIWMSLSIAFYIYFERRKEKLEFSNILFLSAFLGFIEIVLAQTRYLILLSAFVFSIFLFLKPNKTWFYISLFFSFPLLYLFTTTDVFLYYFQAINTLFTSGLTNEEGKVISYVLESDKRYISFFAIINNLSDPRIYLSYGPLFYNYVGDFFLNTKSDFFDDLSNIVILFIEYGILMYVLMITFVVYVILLRGSDLKKYMNYILILVVIAPLVVYYPRYLFYLFFFLGVCFSMSHKSSLKIDK